MLSKKGDVSRIYLPPDANCLLSVADHCFRSRNYVNLIVIDKQPQLQWLDIGRGAGALRARRLGLGVGEQRRAAASPTWCSACAGDVADDGDRGGGLAAAQARAGTPGARRQRRRPDDAASPPRLTPTAWTMPRSSELFTPARR